ncbi:Pimeloyl-ACP methyl ester carboxylesterase [Arthrobacter sp. ok909]|uniref:alpha/beta fold hydrolase n=1 Tax=Arthrobacter sp. ok909 TaxID=1761746 RepID=UPI00088B2C80|nr:alpha/beta hydrolase [Arthrobacter sp. ok909]SDP63873.1 Pimeloyl-ACP methyl ester carboxylesterase [Arthrobacter sp. ok909]
MIEYQRSQDETKIAYERSGDGPALIIIGGALNNRYSAGPLVPLLSAHFTVYTYDRRGRGDSTDTSPYSPDREVEDLEALINAAGGRAYAYGHSSGAILALEAAAAGAPITKLVAYEPPYLTQSPDAEPWTVFRDRVQAALDVGDRAAAVEMFIRHTGAGFDERIKDQPWWPGLIGVAHTLPYDLTVTGDGIVPADRLAKVSAPTLAIYGGASLPWARASIEGVAAAIPNATQERLEGQDHGVAPDVVAPALIRFFS